MSENERAEVEKVARAICAAKWAGKSSGIWEIMQEHEREHYRRLARAAMEAMKK